MSRTSATSVLVAAKLIYQDATVPVGNTIANQSGSDVAFTSSYTIPANSLTVGKTIRIKAYGVYGTFAVAPNVTGKLKFGSTTITTTGTITSVAGVTNGGWWSEMYLIVTATGASGTVEGQGYAEFATAATTGLSVNMTNTAAITFDTTASQVVTVTIQWSSSNAANTITLRQMTIEYLN